MPRPKKISTEELIKYILEYSLAYPEEKITPPKVGKYLRNNKKIEIADYLIRRNTEAIEYMKSINNDSAEEIENMVSVFHPLDINSFLKTNSSREKLISAISARDQYYSKVARNAGKVFEENKSLKTTINTYKHEVKSLKESIKRKEEKTESKIINKKNKEICKLRRILSEYVYPDAANMLLAKEGILQVSSTLIDSQTMDGKIIHPDTEIVIEKDQEELSPEITEILKGME